MFEQIPRLESGQQLVVYELNEVPWRVIDWYVQRAPGSAIALLLAGARSFTTVTQDEGELHPWTTWPTLHRGVTNARHNIRFINQSLKDAEPYPPLSRCARPTSEWAYSGACTPIPRPLARATTSMYRKLSRQVSKPVQPGNSAFQRFNLRQTQRDGALANVVQVDTKVASDILGMLRSGLRPSTCARLAAHVARERFNPLYRSRHSVLQALVAFDIFQHALERSNVDFCTFFTNHVAGMMHRYWKHTFPEDFGARLKSAQDRFHAGSIAYAMDIASAQIGKLMPYVHARRGRLIVATSMGQEAIDRGGQVGEWRITDVQQFLQAIDWHKPARDMLAMQPDFNFAFNSHADAADFLQAASRLVDRQGQSVWKQARCTCDTVNLGLSPSPLAVEAGEAFLNTDDRQPVRLGLMDMGISLLKRNPGTGYHQPRGVLLLYGAGVDPADARTEVDSTAVRPGILDMFGVT